MIWGQLQLGLVQGKQHGIEMGHGPLFCAKVVKHTDSSAQQEMLSVPRNHPACSKFVVK